MKRRLLGLLIGTLLSTTSHAKLVTEEIRYPVDGQEFTGYLAYDDSLGQRPGVLIVHEWWGHNDYARERAEQLAGEGYTAFALDMYGSGKLANHPKDANAFMTEVFNNLPAAQQRFLAAFQLLNDHPATRKDAIAALGYCFGGAIVLHMARIGTPLDAVISYHGSLGSNLPADTRPNIQGVIQVFTGGRDPMIPAEQVAGFSREMFEAGADYGITVYRNAQHSFTNPRADAVGREFAMPLAYDAAADADSWRQTLALLQRVWP
ncbi:MAG TPA: dienelactone hydrolase family protein [Pseudomonadales bacterium]